MWYSAVWSMRSFQEWLSTRSICFYLKSWWVVLQWEKLTFTFTLKEYGMLYISLSIFIPLALPGLFKCSLYTNLHCLKFDLLRFCWQMVLKLVSKNAHPQKLLLANSIWLAVLQPSLVNTNISYREAETSMAPWRNILIQKTLLVN